MFFFLVLTPISTTSGLWSTGNTRKYHQIDVYIYQGEQAKFDRAISLKAARESAPPSYDILLTSFEIVYVKVPNSNGKCRTRHYRIELLYEPFIYKWIFSIIFDTN